MNRNNVALVGQWEESVSNKTSDSFWKFNENVFSTVSKLAKYWRFRKASKKIKNKKIKIYFLQKMIRDLKTY